MRSQRQEHPEDTAAKFAEELGIQIPGDEDERANRLAGLGPLTGIMAGLGVGASVGLARALDFRPPLALGGILAGGLSMEAAHAPMAVLGVADPRTWAPADWMSDGVPHLVYDLVTIRRRRGPRRQLTPARSPLRVPTHQRVAP